MFVLFTPKLLNYINKYKKILLLSNWNYNSSEKEIFHTKK